MSEITKSAKTKYVVCKIMSFLLTVAPLFIYVIIGLANGDIHKGQKVFLGFTCIMALILTLFNILLKYQLRSPLFLLLLGIYYALNNILPLIIIVCVGIVLDEFVFSPLKRKYKEKYVVNKEIDDRL